jgi:hypothetical protein
LPGVLRVPVPIQLLGHGAELNQEVARQVFGVDLAPREREEQMPEVFLMREISSPLRPAIPLYRGHFATIWKTQLRKFDTGPSAPDSFQALQRRSRNLGLQSRRVRRQRCSRHWRIIDAEHPHCWFEPTCIRVPI